MMNNSGGFEQFCGGEFFNIDNFWSNNVTFPQITNCFLHTGLVWIPVAILLLLSPYQCFLLAKSKRLALPWTALLMAKLAFYVLAAISVAVSLVTLTNASLNNSDQSISKAEIVAKVQLLFSMLLFVLFTLACRYRGLVTSSVISISLLLFSICGIPELITRFSQLAKETEHASIAAISYIVYYFCIILLLILNCFADKRQDYEAVGKQKQCPEYETSFFSQITYSWLNGLCVTGWKRPLKDDDMWSLNDRDSSEVLVNKWQAHWTPRVQAYWRRKDVCRGKQQPNMDDQMMLGTGSKLDVNGEQRYTVGSSGNSGNNQKSSQAPSIIYCLFLSVKWTFIHSGIVKVLSDALQFLNPIILQLFLGFISSNEEPLWKGYFYAAALFVISLVISVLTQASMHSTFRIGMNIRTMLTSAIFKKVLVLSSAARRHYTVGEIVNLMSVDVQRFMDVMQFVNFLWSSPIIMVLSAYFLYQQLGVSVIAGLAVMILLVPFNFWLSIRQRRLQFAQMRLKDNRLKVINEILNGIKVLKFYAWEESFEKQVLEIRAKELKVLKSAAYYAAIGVFSWTCSPVLVTVVSFACFVFLDPVNNVLTPERAFVSLSLFNIMRMPLMLMPMLVSFMVQASVSNKRLKGFLVAEEVDQDMVKRNGEQEESVLIENGTFTWDKETGSPDLDNINLRVQPGQLVAVVGQVGAGKSSLVSAILGEMDKMKGYTGTKGTIAYVPQQAWIQNLTLRENITFSKNFDKTAYEKVVDACALKADLDMLPGGDSTEIGEKGVNLSGGQKQRVSLARAVYENADLYLMDDPLSAVDAHVGRHIFNRVISNEGMLKGKTRILVTHGLGYLKNVDQIIVLRDGRISEVGTYKQLMSQRGAFAELIENYLEQKVKEAEDDVSVLEEVLGLDADEDTIKRLESVISRKSSVGSKSSIHHGQDGTHQTLLRLISRISGSSVDQTDGTTGAVQSTHNHNPTSPHNEALMEAVKQASALMGTATPITPPVSFKRQLTNRKKSAESRAVDATDKTKENASKLIQEEQSATGQVKWQVYTDYLSAVGRWIVIGILLLYSISNAFVIGSSVWLSNWADDSFHNDSMSSDVRVIVYAVLGIGQAAFTLAGAVLMAYGMVSAGAFLHQRLLRNLLHSPMSFYDVTPMGRIINRIGKDVDIIDMLLQMNFRAWLLTMMGVLATLCVILIGLPIFGVVIVPLGLLYYFVQRFYIATSRQLKRLESISRSPLLSHFQETVSGSVVIRAYDAAVRFMEESQRRMDFNHRSYWPNMASNRWLGFRLDLVGNFIVVAAALMAVLSKYWGSNSTAGMIGVAISYALSVTMNLNISVRMASEVESNVVAVERIKEYSETPTEAEWRTDVRPSANWPQQGQVNFDGYKLRYRAGLDLVLKGISCRINGGEKVGIVGRTGAGKSSLTLALFRIVEAAGGRISIDGQDIEKIGLHDLRSRLTIIPQDPVLFSGKLRMNLDPFDAYSDEQIWNALDQAHLKDFVAQTPAKLMYEVAEGGENLSVGQRQLVCLARALLRKTKLLILDEATAAVDLETDDLIQKTIRTYFADCTIFTIAHRLNTIMDSDKVMVLSAGEIVELDSPQHLLQDSSTVFYSMAKEAGIILC